MEDAQRREAEARRRLRTIAERRAAHRGQRLMAALEEGRDLLWEGDQGWLVLLDGALARHLGGQSKRGYDKGSVRDLLRCIRNVTAHFDEVPGTLRSVDRIVHYFEGRFPHLLLWVRAAFTAAYGPTEHWPPVLRSFLSDTAAGAAQGGVVSRLLSPSATRPLMFSDREHVDSDGTPSPAADEPGGE